MPAYRISLFFFFLALKTNQKFAIFVWIFACVDYGKTKTKVWRNCEQRVPAQILTSLILSGDPKTLTPAPWTSPLLGTWSTDHYTDRSTDPPLRTPYKKTTIKMTIRNLTYRLFVLFFAVVVSFLFTSHFRRKSFKLFCVEEFETQDGKGSAKCHLKSTLCSFTLHQNNLRKMKNGWILLQLNSFLRIFFVGEGKSVCLRVYAMKTRGDTV